MANSSTSRRKGGGERREWFVGALGVVFALVLAALAFGPWGDAEAARQSALESWSRELSTRIRFEWNALLDRGELIAPVGDRFTWQVGETTRPQRVAAISAEATSARGSRAFATRLTAAEVLEVYDTNPTAALDQILSALDDADLSVGQRAMGRLRAIQLAARGGRFSVVRAQWSAASEELTGAETDGGLSVLLACGLAAGRALPAEERCAIATRLSRAWGTGELALQEEVPLVVPSDGTAPPVVTESPRLGALARRLEGLAESVDCLDSSFQSRRERFVASGLSELIGPLPEPLRPDLWELRATPAGPFAVRGSASGLREGVFVDPAGVGATMVARLNQNAPQSEGGEWGFEVSRGELDGVNAFLGGWLDVTIRWRDRRWPPEALSAARLARVLRWGLLLAAGSLLLASFAITRALARERRLADLKSTFIANVSHELRTPLASILLMAENLEEGRVTDAEAQGRYHLNIRREAQRLQRLVGDVLDFSRLERGAGPRLVREDLDLAAWCVGVEAEVRDRAARDGVAIEVDTSGLVGQHARCDADALRRVVINLVDNAVKYGRDDTGSDGPGSDGTRSDSAGGNGGAVRFSAQVVGNELQLLIEDHGPGIPSAQLETIFAPFERLADSDGPAGTGLGLAIVRALVEAHGGRVSAGNREVGTGARFEVRVPLDDSLTVASVDEPQSDPAPNNGQPEASKSASRSAAQSAAQSAPQDDQAAMKRKSNGNEQ